MKLLILGGTAFLGRATVEAALARGHEVTLFNRGRTRSTLFPEVEQLHGDRTHDLSALAGRRWDTVIDTSGYTSPVVHASVSLLADAVEHYTFISSQSVYADTSPPGIDERAPLQTLPGDIEDDDDSSTYGARKALCEQVAEQIMPGRVLVVRAGLIVGPHDYIDRFPYWVRRIAQGGTVLAPGQPDQPVQLIDVRDMAEWNIRMAELRQAGVYNVSGPPQGLTMAGMFDACKAASDSDAEFVWVDDPFLVEHEVTPFRELPFWVPAAEYPGFYEIDCRKAFAAGLTCRSLVETARDTLAWDRTRESATEPPKRFRVLAEGQLGLTPEREQSLLREWRKRQEAVERSEAG